MREMRDKKISKFEGLPLIDATKDIELSINKSDVDKSIKKDPSRCAAALAGRRELHTDVRVYLSRTYVLNKNKKAWVRYITPGSIGREITSFDRGASFEPGEYKLKAPSTTSQLAYRRHSGGKNTGTGKPRRPIHTTANVRLSARQHTKIE